jgi:hypothetical protein
MVKGSVKEMAILQGSAKVGALGLLQRTMRWPKEVQALQP